jgi:hypothetical protein
MVPIAAVVVRAGGSAVPTVVAPTQPACISVSAITRFLGAGKTTVLNQTLRDGGCRFAVLVNALGCINEESENHDGSI